MEEGCQHGEDPIYCDMLCEQCDVACKDHAFEGCEGFVDS